MESSINSSTFSIKGFNSFQSIDFPQQLELFYHPSELNFDSVPAISWCLKYYYLAPVTVTFYVFFCFYGKQWMSNKEAFDLRTLLKYWNLFLSLFSFIGMVRTLPFLFFLIYKYGFVATLLINPKFTYAQGSSGLWILFFLISKYLELIDTVFLILRKRPVSFLHWYHHATVLWYTWDACIVRLPAGIYFVAMNYSVHAIMYFYYYISSVLKRSLSWGVFVTIAQLLQMLVGVLVTICSFYYSYNTPKLSVPSQWTKQSNISQVNLIAASLMYSTYFYLFAKYFINRYFKSKHSKSKNL